MAERQAKKFDIYPMEIPKAPSDAEETQALGINKRINKSWDFSSSHMINFGDKDASYGRPPEGSLTEERAKKASKHINNEVLILVSVIRGIGDQDETNPDIHRVKFGKLFEFYTNISNKVAGILLRARRWNLVDFKGEMLYQGQDNDKIITLLVGPDEVPTIRKFELTSVDQPKKISLKEKLQSLNNGSR